MYIAKEKGEIIHQLTKFISIVISESAVTSRNSGGFHSNTLILRVYYINPYKCTACGITCNISFDTVRPCQQVMICALKLTIQFRKFVWCASNGISIIARTPKRPCNRTSSSRITWTASSEFTHSVTLFQSMPFRPGWSSAVSATSSMSFHPAIQMLIQPINQFSNQNRVWSPLNWPASVFCQHLPASIQFPNGPFLPTVKYSVSE